MKKPLYRYQHYDLWGAINLTRDAVLKVRSRELMKCNLSVEQSGILYLLAILDHEPTLTEVSMYLVKELHSLSKTVMRMENLGLLKRAKDAKRKNVLRLSLTDEGRQAYTCARNRESIEWIMSVLSEKEEQQLTSCLNKILNRALEQLGINKLPHPSSQLESKL